ncbi:leucine-rich repeat and transmembrane domain-containing protein 2-like [Stylophora pistillata]|uniref:leucine-rich repeat and transmembrane domain-containing protein 2-like n=1 Tax=Stylophora pistillata TaxID=50429 RepID=UPI000C04A99F|nr:leucine-rich repeat and transmembrane domain-containing protein 2-like [Stylophora pistillata]
MNNMNYSCELQRDGKIFKRNISLRVEECPDPCKCDVFQQTSISVNCSGKNLHSIPWKIPLATEKLEMSNNLLKEMPSGIFQNNTKLVSLFVQNNQLKKLPSGIFNNNILLTYL